jgi:hypothetical protein
MSTQSLPTGMITLAVLERYVKSKERKSYQERLFTHLEREVGYILGRGRWCKNHTIPTPHSYVKLST